VRFFGLYLAGILSTVFFALAAILSTWSFAADGTKKSSILDLPRLQATQIAGQAQVVLLMRSMELDKAESLLRSMTGRNSKSPAIRYNLACLLALRDRVDEAFESLELAVELGFRNIPHLENDPDLVNLRKDKRFFVVLKAAAKPFEGSVWPKFPKPVPAVVKDGEVILNELNLGYDPKVGLFLGLVGRANDVEELTIAKGQGKVGDLLREWFDEGTAAGNRGDFYDNHDGDHSNMNFRGFPQITRIEYGEPLRKRGLHNGLQRHFLFSGVTLGNSSTAITGGRNWRSQARFALTQPNGATRLALHYLRNHLYFYPEHKDHDAGRNGKNGGGHGDVFPANVPYIVVSQGSSGSDRAFMNAFTAMLAALRPETKQVLVRTPLLMPTLQQVFRRSNRNVKSDEDYFTGKAHPTVFKAEHLDLETMVRRVHELRPDSLPPLAQFKVTKEDMPIIGQDFFDFRPHQRLFDTPCASARVYKSTASSLRFTLDAGSSRDLAGRPLSYRWKVLRGDAERIAIKKQDENGSIVEVTIPWHNRRPVLPDSPMESNRVDIGLFVGNADHWSAPAFFSVYFPDNQKRVYDDRGRILSVDYSLGNYVDPLIDTPREWQDQYRYEDNGSLHGWTRYRDAKVGEQEFTSDGLLVVAKNKDGSPAETTSVRYLVRKSKGDRLVLIQEPSN
jgi:hypothetical protein